MSFFGPKLVPIASTDSSARAPVGSVCAELDVNNADAGMQVFVYYLVDDTVAVSQGSPVGEKTAVNGGALTADQSLAGITAWRGYAGGLATAAVTAAGGDLYQYVQVAGINRYAAAGASQDVTAGAHLVWDGDNDINDMADGEEELTGARALVAASSAAIAVRTIRLY